MDHNKKEKSFLIFLKVYIPVALILKNIMTNDCLQFCNLEINIEALTKRGCKI